VTGPRALAITAGMSGPFLSGAVLGVVLAAAATGALAQSQERVGEERQRLLDLAYALGESHALRQACEGEDDQYWRARMMRLAEVERASEALEAQLRERFNTGFTSRRGEYPVCDDASRKAEARAALRGQALALKLAQSVVQVRREAPAPDSMAEGEAAR